MIKVAWRQKDNQIFHDYYFFDLLSLIADYLRVNNANTTSKLLISNQVANMRGPHGKTIVFNQFKRTNVESKAHILLKFYRAFFLRVALALNKCSFISLF